MTAEVLGVMLRHDLVSVKRPLHPWMIEITKCAVQEAVVELGAAFRAFFEESEGCPRFKRWDICDGSPPPP